ncbi:MAG: TolC family protein [Pseudomonadota bacterium]
MQIFKLTALVALAILIEGCARGPLEPVSPQTAPQIIPTTADNVRAANASPQESIPRGESNSGTPAERAATIEPRRTEHSPGTSEADEAGSSQTIGLAQSVALALERNPELAAFSSEISAREGRVRQAGLLPNPIFGAGLSNAGNSALKNFDGTTTTVGLSQLFLLGGKRAKAIRTARLDQDLAVWDHESKRMDVMTQVVKAFVELLRAQEQQKLAGDLVALAERVEQVIASRVRAGQVSPVEETRAKVNLASVKIERQRAERERLAARKTLAALWGSTEPFFESAVGALNDVKPLPSHQTLLERIRENPDLARWASEIAKRQAAVKLAESLAIPDVTLTVGLQQFIETDDSAVVAGISLPLPVFNRNQGGVEEANQRLNKAAETRRNAEVTVATSLNTAYQRLAFARAEVEGYQSAVLPGAESAFAAVQKGYRLGKFSLLDVLDTQRTLFNAKAKYLRALATYHQGIAEVERLVGAPIFEESK